MITDAGRARMWRFARRTQTLALCIIGLSACATGRPEVGPPEPRLERSEPRVPATQPAEPVTRPGSSIVTGDIRFKGGGYLDLGATVVTLRPRSPFPLPRAAGVVRIASHTPEFVPDLRIVRPGQRIVLENRGPVVHRVFSPRFPDRSWALDPGERSPLGSIGPRGAVRFYCSLHADERFFVLVEDAPHIAMVAPDGTFRFGPLAAGRYTLSIWSERVAGPVREVLVDGFTRTIEPIWLDPALIER